MFTCLKKKEKVSRADREHQKKQKSFENKIDRGFQDKIRVLLLGIPGSGKSTISKQLYYAQNDLTMSKEEQEEIRKVLLLNYASAMKKIIETAKLRNIGLKRKNKKFINFIKKQPPHETAFTKLHIRDVKNLWSDPGIQKALYEVKMLPLKTEASLATENINNAQYLNENFARLVKHGEITLDDHLRSRIRTTGIHEIEVNIDHRNVVLIDVGGQKTERRKWIHHFQDVTAVIYVAALDGFCHPSEDRESKNCLDESLKVWKEILKPTIFSEEVAMMVFLNKKDVLKQENTLKKFANEFKGQFLGEPTFGTAVKFIKSKYVNKATEKYANRVLYSHITMALDKDDVNFLFKAVVDTIVRSTLRKIGM